MDSPGICPLCGGPNRCGIAEGKEDCWCFSTPIPEAVLEAIPEGQRMQSCVCQECAARTTEPPAPGDV
jgi:Cysteine-rich CWC